MGWLELLKWLSDNEQATKENQALDALAKQVQIQQKIIENLNQSIENINQGIVLLIIFFAAVISVQYYLYDRKIKKFESRIALLEKMDPTAGGPSEKYNL